MVEACKNNKEGSGLPPKEAIAENPAGGGIQQKHAYAQPKAHTMSKLNS